MVSFALVRHYREENERAVHNSLLYFWREYAFLFGLCANLEMRYLNVFLATARSPR